MVRISSGAEVPVFHTVFSTAESQILPPDLARLAPILRRIDELSGAPEPGFVVDDVDTYSWQHPPGPVMSAPLSHIAWTQDPRMVAELEHAISLWLLLDALCPVKTPLDECIRKRAMLATTPA